ncbi:PEP/pyruvate-binding domain-containing protein [Micromonospora sp. NPDC049114]|uniref:PEP/pyruvate-binding domain-containing protein n=1 Tax=unclassified Micromonospora TaxID=2617518 RepID=UPI0033CBB4DD
MRADVEIVSLEAATAVGVETVGGKAFALARLMQHDVRVPPGFCVTVRGMERLESAQVAAGLAEALTVLGEGKVAVRSSAVAEDGKHESYAGIFRTVLDVAPEPDGVRQALYAVQRSLHEAPANSYRQAMGLAPSSMSAIVQPMIEGDCAGVMFTRDPVTGARQLVIEAIVPGAGSGAADYVVLEPGGALVTPDVEDVAPALASLLPELARVARTCDEVLGEGQDIEWAARDGDLWILQSRPISSLT